MYTQINIFSLFKDKEKLGITFSSAPPKRDGQNPLTWYWGPSGLGLWDHTYACLRGVLIAFIIQLAQTPSSDLQHSVALHQSSLSARRAERQHLWPSGAAPSWARGRRLSPTAQSAPWAIRNRDSRAKSNPCFSERAIHPKTLKGRSLSTQGDWKFRSPQSISGASQQNSAAAFSQATEVHLDLL